MTHPFEVPFLDLITPHREMQEELTRIFHETLGSAAFIGGRFVEEFETAFASFCEADHAIAISSGTDALRFALMASGVKPGDVVITVPNTFIATTEAISQCRAIPEFVDIDEATYNMAPVMLQRFLEMKCIRDSTGALVSLRNGRPVTTIVPVHLYGQMADMDAIMALAEQYGLRIIEDACQAHGAEYYSQRLGRSVKAGSIGQAAAFSFYPGKNLGACGEGGAVTTNDAAIARRVRMLRDHGQVEKYYHDVEGYNGRLDSMQAGFLRAKLFRLGEWNERRARHADAYTRGFAGDSSIGCPHIHRGSKHVFHLYVVRISDRKGLMEHLRNHRIGSAIHYPVPLHQQKAYRSLNYQPGDFPVTEEVSSEILSLPMYPQLRSDQIERVIEAVFEFTASRAGSVDEGPRDTNRAAEVPVGVKAMEPSGPAI